MCEDEAGNVEEEEVRCRFCMVWEKGLPEHMSLPRGASAVLEQMQTQGYTIGVCKRNAPQADEKGMAAWPITSSDNWCGDFVPVIDEDQLAKAMSGMPQWMNPSGGHS